MDNRRLHRFVLLTALATFGLIGLGGLVTSHGVGMAVPDWPNTYGYNMFLFPVSKWLGGIFYEHTHRLLAALVGLLTTILAVWLWVRETRGPARWVGVGAFILVLALMGVRQLAVYITLACLAPVAVGWSFYQILHPQTPCSSGRKSAPLPPGGDQPQTALRWWGIIAFSAVILQGVLGGLRVVWLKDQIGVFHATLAQLFFVLMCSLALFTSRWWQETEELNRSKRSEQRGPFFISFVSFCRGQTLRWLVPATTGLILTQLVLGATMRHQHAGLAIPDFPLAYGKLWPAMDPNSVAHYNQQRLEMVAVNPITAFQIGLQMVHRVMAVVILSAVASCAWLARRHSNPGKPSGPVPGLTLVWLGLILTQLLLGAATIWSNKAADIATGHVLVGALSLGVGTILSIIIAAAGGLGERTVSTLTFSKSAPGGRMPPSTAGETPAATPGMGLNNA